MIAGDSAKVFSSLSTIKESNVPGINIQKLTRFKLVIYYQRHCLFVRGSYGLSSPHLCWVDVSRVRVGGNISADKVIS